MAEVRKNPLPGGSWSAMFITSETVSGNKACLGYSHFTPGSVSDPIAHETEEFVFVAKGEGELRTEKGAVEFVAGDALHIPAQTFHWIDNTGSKEIVMIFGFPAPDYPTTEKHSS